MIYLIGQLSFWLLLTAAFAALAGWAFAAQRAAPPERALRRDRDNLLRDLARLASGEAPAAPADHEADALASRTLVRESRIAALEQQLEGARVRNDEAAAEIAELERRLESSGGAAAEVQRLRAAAEKRDAGNVTDAVVEPAVDEEAMALQTWRLRYFEQRVRYLETQAKAGAASEPPKAGEAEPHADALQLEWRARDAEARAAHLAEELRASGAGAEALAAIAESEPFAANADVDALLRWRLLYLERRVTHLQEAPIAEPSAPRLAEAGPDLDRWKWRARYLEARVRHLEERQAPAAMIDATPTAEEDHAPAPAPAAQRAKPPVLASARNGAPDDLTLVEGVSLLQQTTLYSLGVFHYDQIAAWTSENVAWVDHYLRLRGRIGEEEWVEQAEELAREGPAAARRVSETEET